MPVELELVVILVTMLTGFASASMERQALLLPSADAALLNLKIVFLTSVLREKEEGVKRR